MAVLRAVCPPLVCAASFYYSTAKSAPYILIHLKKTFGKAPYILTLVGRFERETTPSNVCLTPTDDVMNGFLFMSSSLFTTGFPFIPQYVAKIMSGPALDTTFWLKCLRFSRLLLSGFSHSNRNSFRNAVPAVIDCV